MLHADGRTDRYDEAYRPFSQRCELAKQAAVSHRVFCGTSVDRHEGQCPYAIVMTPIE